MDKVYNNNNHSNTTELEEELITYKVYLIFN